MTNEEAVPPAARLIRDFINTSEPQVNTDSLTAPDRLRDWFVDRRMMSADGHLQPSDLSLAIKIREGLRSLLQAHAGHPTDAEALEHFDDALSTVPVRLAFTDDGECHLVSAHGIPLHDALAQLLDAIRQCREDHTWTRLKVCSRDSCRWAFYDASRNQVRRWCSMAGCGNHIKMRRAYAARKGRAARAASAD
jgi:predicted RNA-binding Zn ribbon-like protein